MEQTWRWWGPKDLITLSDICQIGATGIVTALHDIPYGEVWSPEAIAERKRIIEQDKTLGLRWSVVESVPVHEAIKLAQGDDLTKYYENFRQTLRNLAAAGVTTVCYNFMPVLDWARTELRAPLPGGGNALRFNAHEFAAFDCFMLRRAGAEAEQRPDVLARARHWFDAATEDAKRTLLASIMAGLPGAFDRYDIDGLRGMLARYHGVDHAQLRRNLAQFLAEIIPTAEQVGIRMAIHPDDPPRPLLGLPRVCGSATDIGFILDAVPSPSNGLTLCTGSLGANPANDLPAIARRFAEKIHFVHLRNVANEPDGSFMEADHLGGDTDMVAVVKVLLEEQKRRKDADAADWRLPFRPDHGHELLDDVGKATHPGYPAIGRMRGLAEMRGVMHAVAHQNGLPM
ncbi:MAG: mannonate dehydratase [Acetobacteraceae bacterium]